MIESRSATVRIAAQGASRASSGATVSGLTLPWAPETSTDMGFLEQWSGQAFRDQESAGWPDVLADFAHDGSWLLGSTAGGTLRLNVTPAGLEYELDLPAAVSDYLGELIDRGDLAGASIQFQTLSDQWQAVNGTPLRTVNQAILRAVSLVPNPAFPQTTAGIVRPTYGRSTRNLRTLDTSTISAREAARQIRRRQVALVQDERHRKLMDECDLVLGRGRWAR